MRQINLSIGELRLEGLDLSLAERKQLTTLIEAQLRERFTEPGPIGADGDSLLPNATITLSDQPDLHVLSSKVAEAIYHSVVTAL